MADASDAADASVDVGTDERAVDAEAEFCDAGTACTGKCDGTCCRGRCLDTLATGQDNPGAIVVSATNVYWANRGRSGPTGFLNGTGSIVTVPIAGGTPATLATGQAYPFAIAIDGANVYWTNQGYAPETGGGNVGSVVQVPLTGGTPVTLATGLPEPQGIAVDASNVYWTNLGPVRGGTILYGTVMKVPIGGGTPVTLTRTGFRAYGIALDSTNVYWGACDGLSRMPISGGVRFRLATTECVERVSVDSQNVYFTTHEGALKSQFGNVMKLPLAGGAAVSLTHLGGIPDGLATVPLPLAPGAVASDVYWSGDCQPFYSAPGVCRVAAGGGDEARLVADSEATAIAVDAKSIYWTDQETWTSGPDGGQEAGPGRIMRLTPR